MMEHRILVVDDEQDICDILQFNLENEGFLVDVAASAEEALGKLSDGHALILLDVMMAGMSGFAMADMLRKAGNNVPIVFLTAKNAENYKLTGFSLGADDYISKPFSVKEVVARVKAILKRASDKEKAPANRWQYGDLVIDKLKNRVTVKNVDLPLTKKEFDILVLLAKSSPNMLARNEILNSVWDEKEYVLDRTVDVHITRLRKKLGEYSSLIVNRSGFGYYLNFQPKEDRQG